MTPQRSNVILLLNDKELPSAMILKGKIYRIELLDDESIAETYNNGEALPIVRQPL